MDNKEMMTHMTLQDITKKLQEHLPDEIGDTKTYIHMAKSAEEMGNGHLAKYLYAVCKDEFSHADFIYTYLKDSGIAIPEDQVVMFEEVKNKMKHMFH